MLIAVIDVLGSMDRLMNTADVVSFPWELVFWMLSSLGFDLMRHANAETISYCCSILPSEGDATTMSYFIRLDHKAHTPYLFSAALFPRD